MRPIVAVLLGCHVLLASPASGEQDLPYKAFVTAEDVYVRSGPGQSYYPTDKLRRGQEVEVYRHDPGGWCAIRPVEGSFTWVSSRFLNPTEDRLAVVTAENVSARVGSRFSDIRDVVQVRLHKGETVGVLESPPPGTDGNAWYKIAPPSGEFRWVSGKYLDAEYPRDGMRRSVPGARGSESPLAPRTDAAPADTIAYSPEAAGESLRARSARPRSISAEEFQTELDRIELDLSVMVVEEPTVWSFDTMRERVHMLLDRTQTAVERGRARLLADKIARFDDIRRRQEAVLAMRDRTDRTSRVLAGLRPRDANKNLEIDGRFAGVGRLTDVASPKIGAPRYALVDKSNEVRCYVTPAPGVNLRSYIGRSIGVTGTRGYMPEQRANHVMARHITALEGSTLR